jgi:DNA-binding transcriptional LysR family regulator
VPSIIAATDLVCVVPRQLGELYAATGTLRVVPLPIPLPSFEVSLFWHKRFDADQGSVWLRAVIRELFQQKRARKHGGK